MLTTQEDNLLFDILPDAIFVLDSNLSIKKANNIAYSTFGDGLEHMNIADILTDAMLIDKIHYVMEKWNVEYLETSAIARGVYHDYRVSIGKYPANNMGMAVIIILHDITQLRHAKQMMKDFVANASHEIRTPLTAIIGFIETLQSMGRDEEDDRQRFLKIMADQADYMAHLVRDLLSLSKVEMNESNAPDDFVKIEVILESVVKKCQWAASQKNIKLSLAIKEPIPEIKGEIGDLTQVFYNLVGNAIKYSKDDTNVNISSSIAKKDDKDYIVVSVKDEGEGIAPEHLPRITERFYRVDKARSRKIDGTGLGLAIVKHILNRYKADLHVESNLGKGSNFTVCLPVNGN